LSYLKEAVAKSGRAKLGALLMKPVFEGLKRRLEPDEFGVAPLLGVDGVVMIGHGSSNAKAMKNGILTADRYVGLGVAPALEEAIVRHAEVWDGQGHDRPASAAAAE
jgi:glycerol-3-phosphate acyltransferase PlsX